MYRSPSEPARLLVLPPEVDCACTGLQAQGQKQSWPVSFSSSFYYNKITAALHAPLQHRTSTPMPLCHPPAPHVYPRAQVSPLVEKKETKQKPVPASSSVLSFNLHSSLKNAVSELTRLSPKRTGKRKYGKTTDRSISAVSLLPRNKHQDN